MQARISDNVIIQRREDVSCGIYPDDIKDGIMDKPVAYIDCGIYKMEFDLHGNFTIMGYVKITGDVLEKIANVIYRIKKLKKNRDADPKEFVLRMEDIEPFCSQLWEIVGCTTK